jgi:hypothetical protein
LALPPPPPSLPPLLVSLSLPVLLLPEELPLSLSLLLLRRRFLDLLLRFLECFCEQAKCRGDCWAAHGAFAAVHSGVACWPFADANAELRTRCALTFFSLLLLLRLRSLSLLFRFRFLSFLSFFCEQSNRAREPMLSRPVP